MSIEVEIRKKYGKTFTSIPADGVHRKFNIGGDECFAISFGSCGAFGNWTRSELFEWDGKETKLVRIDPPAKKLSQKDEMDERKIVAIGDAIHASGQPMSESDLDRYILALTRIIESNGKQ